MEQFVGTGVALITPFTLKNTIDFDALERLVNYQIENGIDYLVVLGTTAETSTLTKQEKQDVRNRIVEINRSRLPLVVGIGGNDTQNIIEELQTTDLSGFSAILSVSPYYNKPTQEGIYQHFKAISEASPLPILLYNVPPRTGSNMEPNTVIRLANDFKNIVGVKEAAGDFEQALELVQKKPKGFMIISGEDKLALPLTLSGGAGVISVIGQGLPKEFSQIIKLGLAGESTKAFDLFFKLSTCIDLIFKEGNPAGIKGLLHKLKICEYHVRLPLVHVSHDLQQKINIFADTYKKN